jgi:enamine deaminase RidA (YjgF/YER057c/UK114 family)
VSGLLEGERWRENVEMRDAIVTPLWRDFYEATGIPAAVRVGQSVRLTGHTGTRPDGSLSADPAEQLRQTFENVADTLAAAGSCARDRRTVHVQAFPGVERNWGDRAL